MKSHPEHVHIWRDGPHLVVARAPYQPFTGSYPGPPWLATTACTLSQQPPSVRTGDPGDAALATEHLCRNCRRDLSRDFTIGRLQQWDRYHRYDVHVAGVVVRDGPDAYATVVDLALNGSDRPTAATIALRSDAVVADLVPAGRDVRHLMLDLHCDLRPDSWPRTLPRPERQSLCRTNAKPNPHSNPVCARCIDKFPAVLTALVDEVAALPPDRAQTLVNAELLPPPATGLQPGELRHLYRRMCENAHVTLGDTLLPVAARHDLLLIAAATANA